MAQSQVKSYRRNGKIVRGHSRKRSALRNVAIGAGVVGAGVGALAIAKNPRLVKSVAQRAYRKIPLNIRQAVRKGWKKGQLQGRASRLGPAGMAKVQQEANAFDMAMQAQAQKFMRTGASNQQVRSGMLSEWRKLSPDTKAMVLGGLEQNNPQMYRKIRSDLLAAIRDEGPVRQREEAFNRVRAYTQHFRTGGDRGGEAMNPKQYQKVLEKARKEGGGRSASGVRDYIRRELGFNRYLNLTEFKAHRKKEMATTSDAELLALLKLKNKKLTKKYSFIANYVRNQEKPPPTNRSKFSRAEPGNTRRWRKR